MTMFDLPSHPSVYRAVQEQYEKAEGDNPMPDTIQSNDLSIKDITITHCVDRVFRNGEAVAFKSSPNGDIAVLFCQPISL